MESDVLLERHYPEPLLALASYGLESGRGLPTEPISEQDWPTVLDCASSHRLTGLLCTAVDVGALPTTSEQRSHVLQVQLSRMAWVMQLEHELLAVIDLLSRSGVDIRCLKGPAVAHLDYPDPAARSFVDLDVLIRSEKVDDAVAALTAAGFQRRHPQPRPGFDRRFSKGITFLSPTGYELDLHRTFVQGPWGLWIDLNDLWSSMEEFQFAGRVVPALSRPARFMHACYHGALGDWPPRLSSMRDIAQLLLCTGQDELEVHDLISRWRAEAVVAAAIVDSWALLGIQRRTAVSDGAHRYVATRRELEQLAVHRR